MAGPVKNKDAGRHWGMLTGVFLTADPETSLLQITVPWKTGANTDDGKVS